MIKLSIRPQSIIRSASLFCGRGLVIGILAAACVSYSGVASAGQALIDHVESLRDNTAPKEKAQLRALTAKLANMHFSEAVNLISSPNQSDETQRKVLAHRLRAIQLFEGFLKGENGRYEAPTGEQRAASRFNLARLYADTQKIDQAKTIWRDLAKNTDFPSIASESSLNMAEQTEAANPASKEALNYYKAVMELDKRQDMRNYAHYRAAWIERNLDKWPEAIADLKQAMYDAKGQVKEEVIGDLLTFHALSDIPADQALSYFQDLGGKTSRADLPSRLADAYLAVGKKAQAVMALQNVASTRGSLVHSVRLLEEAYGLRDWSAYSKGMSQIEGAKLENAPKDQQADIFKILKRLVVQLDAEKLTSADTMPHFVAATETFLRFFPGDEDVFRMAASLVHVEKDPGKKAARIQAVLDNSALKISAKDRQVLREELVSAYQILGKHEAAAAVAMVAASSTEGSASDKDKRRFNFIRASELMDGGKEKDALPIFVSLARDNPADDIGLKSQMVAIKAMGKAGDFKNTVEASDAFIIAIKAHPELKTTKEYLAIIEVRDRAEFELAVSGGNTPETLRIFQTFCVAGQFTPKSCENAESVAVKTGNYDALLAILRLNKKAAEVTQVLESSARFDEAARDLEKSLLTNSKAVKDYMHVAILFEISGHLADRDRILGQMVASLSGRAFASPEEESLVFSALEDADQLKGKALGLKWNEVRQCALLDRAVLAGDTSKKSVDTLLACKNSPGRAWNAQATKRVEALDAAQVKIGFYGNGSKKKFERRLAAINVMAKEVERLLPAADSATYISLASRAKNAYEALAKEIESTPIPAEVTEEMMPEIRQGLASLAAPMKQKSEAYAGFIAKEESSTKDQPALATTEVKKPEPVAPSDIARSIGVLQKDPQDRAALSQIRETFARKGNMRVAAYFDGRMKQVKAKQ